MSVVGDALGVASGVARALGDALAGMKRRPAGRYGEDHDRDRRGASEDEQRPPHRIAPAARGDSRCHRRLRGRSDRGRHHDGQ